ncbi:MAG: alpha/beta hydrolase [Actinomycetota bacterium]
MRIDHSPDLPAVPPAIVGAIGRPLIFEAMAPFERRRLRRADIDLPPGDGRPVVIATGYFAPPSSADELAGWLRSAGYRVEIADMNRNRRTSSEAVERIEAALEAVDGPALLIGHSRGGQQSRVATQRRPDLVSELITLGAPVRVHLPRQFVLRGSVEASRLAARLGLLAGADEAADTAYERDLADPFAVDVPWTTVWSRRDGIVEWQLCLDPAATSIEVTCSHTGLLASSASYRAIAQALRAGSAEPVEHRGAGRET